MFSQEVQPLLTKKTIEHNQTKSNTRVRLQLEKTYNLDYTKDN